MPPKHVLTVDDLDDGLIDEVLSHATMTHRPDRVPDAALIGMVFLEASLRTRAGFTAATARMGWRSIEVNDRRHSDISMHESVEDTLRTVAGMTDLVVGRLGIPLGHAWVESWCPVPFVNAGSRGPLAQHPTQALIDLAAMEAEVGPVGQLHIAVCGELSMRSVRSLVAILARRPPRLLSLISAPGIDHLDVPAGFRAPIEARTLAELHGVDVLYVAGISHNAVDEHVRARLRINTGILQRLDDRAVVLSPLPVIDEIDPEVILDPRVRVFQQSDRGVEVRRALLENLLTSA